MTGRRARSIDRVPLKPVIGRACFAAMSAVEGLRLNSDGMQRVSADKTTDERRADILKAYMRDVPKR